MSDGRGLCARGERILPIEHAVADEWGRLSSVRSLPVKEELPCVCQARTAALGRGDATAASAIQPRPSSWPDWIKTSAARLPRGGFCRLRVVFLFRLHDVLIFDTLCT